jgi:hypothetical protein
MGSVRRRRHHWGDSLGHLDLGFPTLFHQWSDRRRGERLVKDVIFGSLLTDDLKLIHHRANRQELQHQHQLTPRDPLPNAPVMLTVYTGANLGVDHIACYYTTDGSEPIGQQGVAQNGHVVLLEKGEIQWDTLVWGYHVRWQGMLPPQPEGVIVRYRIGAWREGGPQEIYADFPFVKTITDQATGAYFRGESLPENLLLGTSNGHTFTYRVDRLEPPAWARDAIIYHIFVDRFYPGDGREWLQTRNLSDFLGGTLWGVRDKLDYLEALGINCLWLSPTFVSPSAHGYDIADFYHAEPRMGGDEALHGLIEAAHRRGMRVLLDLACNHLSDQHPIFQSALREPTSPYRNWFYFDDSDLGYQGYFGVPSMPQINVHHPDARQWLLDIARYWLREFRVDGYRLDYVVGPGPDFWTYFWAACKEERPDCLCFGEAVESPDTQREYIGRMDGLLDFHLTDALRKTFARGMLNPADLDRFVERHQAFFPSNFLMPSFLDNHDMNRFLFLARGKQAALRQAAAYQMRLPNPPVIFYGTEVGVTQTVSVNAGVGLEECRTPMLWGDHQDQDLLAFYREVIRGRQH